MYEHGMLRCWLLNRIPKPGMTWTNRLGLTPGCLDASGANEAPEWAVSGQGLESASASPILAGTRTDLRTETLPQA